MSSEPKFVEGMDKPNRLFLYGTKPYRLIGIHKANKTVHFIDYPEGEKFIEVDDELDYFWAREAFVSPSDKER